MISSEMSSRRFILALAMGIVGAACNNDAASSATAAQPSASAAAPAVSASAAAPPPKASASASAAPASADAGNAEAEAAQEEQMVEELHAHHRHQHAGFVGFVMSAVETLGVAPEQQAAIDSFRKEYHKHMKPLREANHALTMTIADGLAAGTIDHAKVNAELAKATAAAPAVNTAIEKLLGELHKALRPEQRAALVDKVDAHFSAWKEVSNHPAEGAKADRPLKRLAKELNLTKDQVEKIHATLDGTKEKKTFDTAAADAYLKAFDSAFTADPFDAKKLPPAGPESGKIVSWGGGRMAALYEAMAPVLTPEQRTTLATKLRERAEAKEKEKEGKEKP
jgi:Spy/CpxP family protein refolding chaperone